METLKYETFLQHQLLPDLNTCLRKREELLNDIQELMITRQQLQVMKESSALNATAEPIKTMMNVGCDYFMQAKIEDPSKVYMAVGANTYPEMSIEEGIQFLLKKESIQQR
jgi:prefoldin subunit 5